MDPSPVDIIHNVPHAAAWGLPIAQYLYFAGLSAGSFLAGVIAWPPATRPGGSRSRRATCLALALLAAGLVCLVLDLEQPLRFWHVFVWFNPASSVSWGAWLLAGYGVCLLLHLWLLSAGRGRASAALRAIGVLLALSVPSYAGLLLSLSKARAFWHSALVPPQFIASALASGAALLVLVEWALSRLGLREDVDVAVERRLVRLLCGAIAVGLCLAVAHLVELSYSHPEAALAASVAMHSPLYVVGALAFGHALPLLLLCLTRPRCHAASAAASAMTLLGALCMRCALLDIGQAIPLS